MGQILKEVTQVVKVTLKRVTLKNIKYRSLSLPGLLSSKKYSHELLQGLLIFMLQSESGNKLNMLKIPHFSNFS